LLFPFARIIITLVIIKHKVIFAMEIGGALILSFLKLSELDILKLSGNSHALRLIDGSPSRPRSFNFLSRSLAFVNRVSTSCRAWSAFLCLSARACSTTHLVLHHLGKGLVEVQRKHIRPHLIHCR
jgi:hypothetical protein